jgi:folate-binding protein YgfZ
MPNPSISLLTDRGVVAVTGDDAIKLMDGLVTADLDRLATEPAVHTALLSPQGKILFEFFLVHTDNGLLVDMARAAIPEFVKRLTMYRLRAKAVFNDESGRFAVAALWGAETQLPAGIIAYADPRGSGMGLRLIVPADRLQEIPADVVSEDSYHDHRIAHGVGEGGRDYPIGDAWPHEANFDRMRSVDFRKGCYVGQEVVSRMQHKTVVRKRVTGLTSATGLVTGAEIKAGDVVVGAVGSVCGDGRRALALLKLDRIADALEQGTTVTAGDADITVDPAAIERYRAEVAAKKTGGA